MSDVTRILVTGSHGVVGSEVVRELRVTGRTVVEFDLVNGRDIRSPSHLHDAVAGCDAVIHSAALLGAPTESPEDISATNVDGTRNVLAAAVEANISRLVFLSSVDVLGVFKGERAPDYLPLDDAHPCYGVTPYARSKRAAEEACRTAAEKHRMSVIALRPPGVWSSSHYSVIQRARAERASFEWSPYWEYGAFLDVRDSAHACVCALKCEMTGFEHVLVASADITTSGRTAREWARFVHPDVEWCGGSEYDTTPFRSLVRTDSAQRLLRWVPEYSWQRFMEEEPQDAV